MGILSKEQMLQVIWDEGVKYEEGGGKPGNITQMLRFEWIAEAAYRETLKMVARLNKFPQCKGIVITVEDWEALNKLEVSNED